MKISGRIILAILIGRTLVLPAQEATNLDLQGRRGEVASPERQPAPSASVPELSDIDQIFKQTSLGKEADEQRLHIEWRQLANQMTNDPEVIAAKKSAGSARSDLEKRERLRAYYDIYYGKMRALASSDEMKRALDALKQEHLRYINQPRVRHETDGALPTPVPTPHHRRK
ncbi:MAG TPA: hypothetical protein VEI58_08690 [Chthoniobacterales bacterium]|nr:hypothetical protein [Chthoniobacterales bacterium]